MPKVQGTLDERRSGQSMDYRVSIYPKQSQDTWKLIKHDNHEHELCHQNMWVPILTLSFLTPMTLYYVN